MAKVQILADTCCDLTPGQIKERDIGIIPLYVVIEEKAYKDTVEINPEMIYDYYDKTGKTPKTSAANIGDYIEFFEPYVKAGIPVVYIGLSSYMSSTMENARAAAAQFEDAQIFCVDSKNLSTGIGLIVLRAWELAQEGKTAAEIAAEAERLTELSRASFVIDTLDYLRSGGRCSSIAALGASLLSLKPEIAVRNGQMSNRSKHIGTMVNSVKKYARNLLANPSKIDPTRCFVTYTLHTDPAIVEAVDNIVKESGIFSEILYSNAGCVITTHCGKNCIGLLFLEKE